MEGYIRIYFHYLKVMLGETLEKTSFWLFIVLLRFISIVMRGWIRIGPPILIITGVILILCTMIYIVFNR